MAGVDFFGEKAVLPSWKENARQDQTDARAQNRNHRWLFLLLGGEGQDEGAEAVNCFLAGETAVGLSMLRDLVNAQISFKELARQTGLGEKSLHRMLGRNGNPTAHNLAAILRSIAEDLRVKPRGQIAAV